MCFTLLHAYFGYREQHDWIKGIVCFLSRAIAFCIPQALPYIILMIEKKPESMFSQSFWLISIPLRIYNSRVPPSIKA